MDSGVSSTIAATLKSKQIPTVWTINTGTFTTNKQVALTRKLIEFSAQRITKWTVNIDEQQKLYTGYDMILGRDFFILSRFRTRF